MSEIHDPARYRRCMQEIVRRLKIFEQAVRPVWKVEKPSIPNVKMGALQLRKIYELVAFSSISANKSRYEAVRKSFEKDWRLADILNKIERFNPKFLPISLVENWGDGSPNHPHEIKQGPLKFEKANLLKNHGMLGELLHARNPYAADVDYRFWLDWIVERCSEVASTLECHAVMIEYQKTMYRVAMRDAETDDVMVIIMNFELNKELGLK